MVFILPISAADIENADIDIPLKLTMHDTNRY